MKLTFMFFLTLLFLAGCDMPYTQQSQYPQFHNQGFVPNAYGPGVNKNSYGQAVQLRPDFGGVSGEQLQITPNAYGLGVHSDQYGRPVREYPWP